MKVVIQRVSKASVLVKGKVVGQIKFGLLIFLGVSSEDNIDDIHWLTNKISNLRIFNNKEGIMNLSIKDKKGEVLVISQFTLYAKTKRGNRPSYIKAAKPKLAILLYSEFIKILKQNLGREIQTGVFGANMKVNLVNDGPVTLIIDSKNRQ
ncbi:MAG: D-tyrosyl-tRNA(Tyr) deacylase [Flavobacteriaceae bacterium]|nr:D-tyrosyl-tRNA(Tyr) deacylase [Flavobacteriaceae bacterium]